RWKPGHGHLGNSGMLLEHLSNLARMDVVPAGNDQLLDASADSERSVLGNLADVAGAKPAIDKGVRRGGGIAPVASEDLAAFQLDFVKLAEANFHGRERIAHAARLARPLVWVGDDD